MCCAATGERWLVACLSDAARHNTLWLCGMLGLSRKRNAVFAMPFYTYVLEMPSFYQDRLGTNIGKIQNKMERFLQVWDAFDPTEVFTKKLQKQQRPARP
jgi:hypothetical protein